MVAPDEPPPAMTRLPSMPKRVAFRRNQRTALLASSAHAWGTVWCMLSIRYSAEAATKPRVAKYSAALANCCGVPVAQLPPKKKMIAGRRPLFFQPEGKYRFILKSPCAVVLYTATALLSISEERRVGQVHTPCVP